MGYKQELKRQYSTVQIFAVAFSIMSLVPSIASTISFSLPAGPAGMVWVCLIAYLDVASEIAADWEIIGLADCEYLYSVRWFGIGMPPPPSSLRRIRSHR